VEGFHKNSTLFSVGSKIPMLGPSRGSKAPTKPYQILEAKPGSIPSALGWGDLDRPKPMGHQDFVLSFHKNTKIPIRRIQNLVASVV